MITPHDTETLKRLLGGQEIPDKVQREYAYRHYWFCQDGNSGPLGTLGIIDLLRFVGFAPTLPVDGNACAINWDKIKRGERVDVHYNDRWLPAEFIRFGMNRTAECKIDGDEVVREFYRSRVRSHQNLGELLDDSPNWATVEVNAQVFVDVSGDTFEGTFVRVANDGQLIVLVEDEEMAVAPAKVTQAAAAA